MNCLFFLGVIVLGGVWAAGGAFAAGGEARQPLQDAIREHRMGTIHVQAPPGAEVRVHQLEHEFWFGTAIRAKLFRQDSDAEKRRKYLHVLKNNFNSAVHENALKWYHTQRRRGKPNWQFADRILQWCEENGLRMRGHCIFWAKERYVQDWVKDLSDEQLREAVERRAGAVPSRYRGRILEYDVNNEMVPGSYFKDRLGEGIRADMFRWAHEGDPEALLFVNDYNILNGRDLAAYEDQIEGLMEAGAPLGGIGCQGHFGEPVEMQRIRESLDRLARFGLPIKVTEFDINVEDEGIKAKFLRDFYTTCFAHPAVDGILMWGFWEGAHWRPDAAPWKRDFTPSPAAEAYRELVFERWWTRWEGTADEQGRCEVPAFYGPHRVFADGVSRTVYLHREDGRVKLDLTDGK